MATSANKASVILASEFILKWKYVGTAGVEYEESLLAPPVSTGSAGKASASPSSVPD